MQRAEDRRPRRAARWVALGLVLTACRPEVTLELPSEVAFVVLVGLDGTPRTGVVRPTELPRGVALDPAVGVVGFTEAQLAPLGLPTAELATVPAPCDPRLPPPAYFARLDPSGLTPTTEPPPELGAPWLDERACRRPAITPAEPTLTCAGSCVGRPSARRCCVGLDGCAEDLSISFSAGGAIEAVVGSCAVDSSSRAASALTAALFCGDRRCTLDLAPGTRVRCGVDGCLLDCAVDRADCNRAFADGCETDTSASDEHCGSCRAPCLGGTNCAGGECLVACTETQQSCDGPDDVCETDLSSSPLHCGRCGRSCVENGVCTNGECECAPGYSECFDGAPTCVSLAADANCGSCTNVCRAGTTCRESSSCACRVDAPAELGCARAARADPPGDPATTHSPALSFDGSRLAVVRTRPTDADGGELWFVDRRAGTEVALARTASPAATAIDGAGRRVAFRTPEGFAAIADVGVGLRVLARPGDQPFPVEELALSRDGRSLAFTSNAAGLVDGAPPGVRHVYVADLEAGTLQGVTTFPIEPHDSQRPVISGDGRFVGFFSRARLAPTDPDAVIDAYLFDRQLGTFDHFPLRGAIESSLDDAGARWFVSSLTDLEESSVVPPTRSFSTAIGPDRGLRVAYPAGSDLVLLRCPSPGCRDAEVTPLVPLAGTSTAPGGFKLLVLADGRPVVLLRRGTDLVLVECTDPTCKGGGSERILARDLPGRALPLRAEADLATNAGSSLFVTYTSTSGLYLLYCPEARCERATPQWLFGAPDLGDVSISAHPSGELLLTFEDAGAPHLARVALGPSGVATLLAERRMFEFPTRVDGAPAFAWADEDPAETFLVVTPGQDFAETEVHRCTSPLCEESGRTRLVGGPSGPLLDAAFTPGEGLVKLVANGSLTTVRCGRDRCDSAGDVDYKARYGLGATGAIAVDRLGLPVVVAHSPGERRTFTTWCSTPDCIEKGNVLTLYDAARRRLRPLLTHAIQPIASAAGDRLLFQALRPSTSVGFTKVAEGRAAAVWLPIRPDSDVWEVSRPYRESSSLPAYPAALSGDGATAAFATRSGRVLAGDDDGLTDVFLSSDP